MTTIREPVWTADEERRGDGAPRRLESVVVRYDGEPDRRTVYPPGLSEFERASTWLSADDDAFVDLRSLR